MLYKEGNIGVVLGLLGVRGYLGVTSDNIWLIKDITRVL